MSLKELTMSQHRNAERQRFAGVLMSGKISEDTYLKYLMNQHHCYSALENLKEFKLPDKRLKRSKQIQKDIDELLDLLPDYDYKLSEVLTDSTMDYVKYVKENINTQEDFMAHVYVRYLGDLRGGQMIKKKVPGRGKYYEFEEPEELANSIYRQLNDDMADEAKKVFDFATRLFAEMSQA